MAISSTHSENNAAVFVANIAPQLNQLKHETANNLDFFFQQPEQHFIKIVCDSVQMLVIGPTTMH